MLLLRGRYDVTLRHCTHGPRCKAGRSCNHGRRVHQVAVLGGHVLSYLSDLNTLVQRVAHSLSYSDKQLKVVRVDCDDERRLVGLQMPANVIDMWIDEIVQGR